MKQYASLLTQIQTTTQKNMLLEAIDRIQHSLYSLHPKQLDTIVAQHVSTSLKETITALLSSCTTLQKKTQLFAQLSEILRTAPVARLTLAFAPSEALIADISHSIKESIGAETLLEITTDYRIIGGLTISFQGRYRDFSLSKKLDAYFEKHL